MMNLTMIEQLRRFDQLPLDESSAIAQEMSLMLGDVGITIMQAISQGMQDVDCIHYFTGIPRPCIAGRLSALESMSFIGKTALGYILQNHGIELLEAMA